MRSQAKKLVKKLIPASLLRLYRARREAAADLRLQKASAQDVFTEIYTRNLWGGAEGEFCSGPGSVEPAIVYPYLAMVQKMAAREGFSGMSFVDLGCGDFRVGSQLVPLSGNYVGVDVVAPLIEFNQEKYGSASVQFVHLDIVKDELPVGDVCFVRQVLQHLSNEQISLILPKLAKYQWVFITEHHPASEPIAKNLDKTQGGGIRATRGSGVYLDAAPFSLPASSLELVLEVARTGEGAENDPGVLRTFLYKSGARG